MAEYSETLGRPRAKRPGDRFYVALWPGTTLADQHGPYAIVDSHKSMGAVIDRWHTLFAAESVAAKANRNHRRILAGQSTVGVGA